jgi:hypothetical protein
MRLLDFLNLPNPSSRAVASLRPISREDSALLSRSQSFNIFSAFLCRMAADNARCLGLRSTQACDLDLELMLQQSLTFANPRHLASPCMVVSCGIRVISLGIYDTEIGKSLCFKGKNEGQTNVYVNSKFNA